MGFKDICHISNELILRIGVQLTSEMEDQAAIALLETSSEGYGQTLKFGDGLSPPRMRSLEV